MKSGKLDVFYLLLEYCAEGNLYEKIVKQKNTPFEEKYIIHYF
jgi:hypothetical protein